MSVNLSANRDFRLLWIGGLLSGLGGYVAALTVPLLVLAETGSPAQVGLVSAAVGAVALLCMLPGGAIVDAMDRRRLMIVVEFIAAVLALGLALAVYFGLSSLILIAAVAMAGPVLSSLYGPAAGAMLTAAVPAEQIGLASSRLQARSAAARVAGPLIGGVLFSWSPALPLLAEGIGLAGSVLCLLALRVRSVPSVRTSEALRISNLTLGVRFIWRQPFLRSTTLLAGVGLNAGFAGVMTIAIAETGLSDPSGRTSSLVLAAPVVGTLLGTFAASPLKVHERARATVLLAGWTLTAAVSVFVVVTALVPVIALITLGLFTAALANVAYVSAMLTITPADLLGRVQSAAGLASMIFTPIGSLAGGLLLERVGHIGAVGIFALVFASCSIVASATRATQTPVDDAGGLSASVPPSAGKAGVR